MNKTEAIKTGVTVSRYAACLSTMRIAGGESVVEDDIPAAENGTNCFCGPHAGFFIAVRMPGGQTTSAQLQALADIALAYGNGVIDIA